MAKEPTVKDILDTFSEEELDVLHKCIGFALSGSAPTDNDRLYWAVVRERLNDDQKKVFDYLVGCALDEREKAEGIIIVKEE